MLSELLSEEKLQLSLVDQVLVVVADKVVEELMDASNVDSQDIFLENVHNLEVVMDASNVEELVILPEIVVKLVEELEDKFNNVKFATRINLTLLLNVYCI